MALEKYKEKRNFKETPEPKASKAKKEGALKFVIQRHLASRLHYDVRLEMEGVLKSWAVPKGPSLNPKDKRLAMMVEDHPFEYRTFEGEIPEGNYGAGIVEIWDEGTYHSLETTDRKLSEKKLLEQLHKGSIKVVLDGKKVKGEFALVKLKGKEDNSWILIKHNDEFAVRDEYDSEEHISPQSKIPPHASSRKVLKQKKSEPAKQEQKKEKPLELEGKISPMPHDIKPMLATLTDKPFSRKDWIYEIKWDGYRAIAEIEKGKVKLYSRNLLSFNDDYPTIVKSLEKLGHDAIIDGEVVAIDQNGFPSFQLLQNRKGSSDVNIHFYPYDILYVDGHNLTDLILLERKQILQSILPSDLPNIKYSDHVFENGEDFFKEAQKNKLEGIIAKDANSPYRIGRRSTEWLKIKTSMRQEAVVAGFTAPRGSRKLFGALVLGVYDDGEFKYIGHSGGGFNSKSLPEVYKKLEPLIQKSSPFKGKVPTNMPVTWVKPELVCEIQFSEWTGDGHMRHPIFQGLREDKNPKDVMREKEINVEEAVIPEKKNEKKAKKAAKANSDKPKTKAIKGETKSQEDVPQIIESTNKKNEVSGEIVLDGTKLKLSNLSKVYWPEEQYTKRDLIQYYLDVSDYILPYLKNRPENLNRHPNGIHGESFYQKDTKGTYPEWLETRPIFSESNNKDVNYLVCNDQRTLTYMNNLGCIEINPWNSRIDSLENPDYIVIDLDPGENTFEEVIETALVVKGILDKGKIESYIKTSGATGMHIYIPMGAKYDYDQAKEFAHIIAIMAHEELTELTSLERSPKNRRKQIYLDYLQNRKGQTLACAYSVRPKPGATVSTPLHWKEVKPGLHPSQFDIHTIRKRLQKEGDIFQGIFGKGIDISKCIKNLEG